MAFSIRDSIRASAASSLLPPTSAKAAATAAGSPNDTLEEGSAPPSSATDVEPRGQEETDDATARRIPANKDIEKAKRLESIRVTYSRQTGMVYVKFAKARSVNKGKRRARGKKGRSRKKDGGKCKCSSHAPSAAAEK